MKIFALNSKATNKWSPENRLLNEANSEQVKFHKITRDFIRNDANIEARSIVAQASRIISANKKYYINLLRTQYIATKNVELILQWSVKIYEV